MNSRAHRLLAALLLALLPLAACQQQAGDGRGDDGGDGGLQLDQLLGEIDDTGFARAVAPRDFHFPADHGAHRDFRSEWWYLTGQLGDTAGHRYGFQITFFRFALAPADTTFDETNDDGADQSRWHSTEAWMAHFALSDAAGGRFFHHERFARGALGLAGAERAADGGLQVWLDDWRLEHRSGDHWRLRARHGELALALALRAQKPPVLHGADGLSQKGAAPGNASYYYSLPRLAAEGELRIDGQRRAVSGDAWLDREWSTSSLDAGVAGWDWLSLQLDDGRELMLYRLRRADGSATPQSYAALIDADGGLRALDYAAVEWTPTRHWRSPAGRRYPVASRLRIDALGAAIELRPLLDAQELDGALHYWEGAMRAERDGALIGRGYLEMTGYPPGRN